MSHPQGQKPAQQPSNQSLTGCVYQVVQVGLPGSNVLKLLPILKPKDNPLPAVPSPVTPSAPALNLPQTLLSSPPPPVPIISRPSPVSVPHVQAPAFGNYIIAAQNNLTNTLDVGRPFSFSQETAFFLDNSQLSFPTNSVQGNPMIFMMNKKLASPVKPAPMLPSGHSLQIPAHAEVRSVPASSLPFAIQKKILPQSSGSDMGRMPSVIYVSPVNTVKGTNNLSASLYPSPVSSSITPGTQSFLVQKPPSSGSEASNGPMKWVVQENKEAAACLVPVKSSNETASKILQMLSKTKMEDVNLTNSDQSKVMQVKDNALVMCNNKIFLLTKKGTELIDPERKNPEPPQYSLPDKLTPKIEPMKDFSNRVVQVVLSKNKSPPPSTEQSVQSSVVSTAKPKRKSSTPQAHRGDPNVLHIPGDEVSRREVSVKPQETPRSLLNPAGSSTLNTANKGDSGKKTDQLLPNSTDAGIVPSAEASEVNGMDDRSWRLRFGLVKKEKIILKRMPLIGAQSATQPDSRPRLAVGKDVEDPVKMQLKRKSSIEQTVPASKKQKRAEGGDLGPVNVPPVSPSSSPVFSCSAVTGGRNPFPVTRDFETTEASRSIWSPSYYGEEAAYPPDSKDFQVHQESTEHFSPASLPRFHIDSLSSMYPDETTKDEKIQRLKEVLEEREKALEALRHQKNT
ncbi:ligand-dependent nuclear receptor-interacting factor 1 isoform X2 [Bufo gargarizans]|uniref:ligand-dependent nuclear receptor-interacting factor 1 isoform X2 n=1 Tax=Bufo gargarizans TaxID=30331 RepID=UPI001CF5A2A5|nr:ligand-dependent nuclear receptor-interacting factor 1 isoform X2 [Bufo gargarizans]